jgi:hypothetical protein
MRWTSWAALLLFMPSSLLAQSEVGARAFAADLEAARISIEDLGFRFVRRDVLAGGTAFQDVGTALEYRRIRRLAVRRFAGTDTAGRSRCASCWARSGSVILGLAGAVHRRWPRDVAGSGGDPRTRANVRRNRTHAPGGYASPRVYWTARGCPPVLLIRWVVGQGLLSHANESILLCRVVRESSVGADVG